MPNNCYRPGETDKHTRFSSHNTKRSDKMTKRCSPSLLTVCSIISFLCSRSLACVTIQPSGDTTGKLDVEALRRASDADDCLVLSAGVFYLDSNYFRSTGVVPTDCTNQLGYFYDRCKDAVTDFRNRENILVTGSATEGEPTVLELVHYDKSGPQFYSSIFNFDNSRNVTVQDLTIGFGPNDLNHFLGVVTEVRRDNALIIQVPAHQLVDASYIDYTDNYSPITIDNESCSHSQKIEAQQDVFFAEHFMRIDKNRRPTAWEKFVGGTGLEYDASYLGCSKDKGCEESLVLVEFYWPSSLYCRTKESSIGDNFRVGDFLLVIHQKRVMSGIRFQNVDGLTVKNLVLGNMGGAAVVGTHVRNLHVDGLVAKPPDNGWRTLNDVIWVRGYAGTNTVQNLYLENMSDDYVNFHTRIARLQAGPTGDDFCVETEPSSWWWWEGSPAAYPPGIAAVYPSDMVNLYDNEQSLIWQGTFRSRELDSSSLSVVCFNPNPDEKELLSAALLRVAYATALEWMPQETLESEYALVIRNVTVINSRSRGLIQGSHTLLEDIKVVDDMMSAVVVTSGPDWLEGAPPSHVTIRNSFFDNSGINTHGFFAAIHVGADIIGEGVGGLDTLSTATNFRNIVIQNVTIRNPPQAAILAAGVEDLLLEDITIEGARRSLNPWNKYNRKGSKSHIGNTFDNANSCQIFLYHVSDVALYTSNLDDYCAFPSFPITAPTTSETSETTPTAPLLSPTTSDEPMLSSPFSTSRMPTLFLPPVPTTSYSSPSIAAPTIEPMFVAAREKFSVVPTVPTSTSVSDSSATSVGRGYWVLGMLMVLLQ
eukprot:scaffold6688_cov181-Amphora_coffeaeformis.AAC.2